MYASDNLSTSRTILATTALIIALGFAGCKSAPTTPTDDAGLTAALQSRIAGDGALSSEAIQPSVQNQVATLNGTVSNEAARSLAAADAAPATSSSTAPARLPQHHPQPRRHHPHPHHPNPRQRHHATG